MRKEVFRYDYTDPTDADVARRLEVCVVNSGNPDPAHVRVVMQEIYPIDESVEDENCYSLSAEDAREFGKALLEYADKAEKANAKR